MEERFEPPARRAWGRLPALDTPVVRIRGEGPRILAELVLTLALAGAVLPVLAVLGGRASPDLFVLLVSLLAVAGLAAKIRREARSLLILDNRERTIHREIELPGFTLKLRPVRFEDLERVELQGSPRVEAGRVGWDLRVLLVARDGRDLVVVPATRHEADATADAGALAEHLGIPFLTDDELRPDEESGPGEAADAAAADDDPGEAPDPFGSSPPQAPGGRHECLGCQPRPPRPD